MGDDTHYEAAGDERHQNAMASERQANEVIKHIPLFGEVYGGVSAAVYQGIGEFEESEKRGTEVGDGALRDAQAAVDAALAMGKAKEVLDPSFAAGHKALEDARKGIREGHEKERREQAEREQGHQHEDEDGHDQGPYEDEEGGSDGEAGDEVSENDTGEEEAWTGDHSDKNEDAEGD